MIFWYITKRKILRINNLFITNRKNQCDSVKRTTRFLFKFIFLINQIRWSKKLWRYWWCVLTLISNKNRRLSRKSDATAPFPAAHADDWIWKPFPKTMANIIFQTTYSTMVFCFLNEKTSSPNLVAKIPIIIRAIPTTVLAVAGSSYKSQEKI